MEPAPPRAADRPRLAALEDELLAVRCQLGEQDAFDALIARWQRPLAAYVRRLIADEETAADTVQDVWLRIWRGIARLRDAARFRAWMFGIARRAVMDRLREKYAEPAPLDVDPSEIPDAADPDLAERVASLHEELARLPLREREALVLFYLEELTLGELSEVWSVPVGTVKSRLFRARQALRRLMTEGEVSP